MFVSARVKKRLLLAFLGLPALVFAYVTVGLFLVHRNNGIAFSYRNAGTDLVFASSSGRWMAEENLLRGKHFAQIVLAHELYKIHCHHPAAMLVRLKPNKRPWNWAYWFDDYHEPKWRVPYLPGAATGKPEPCAAQVASAAESAAAQNAAHEYLLKLTTG